MASGQSGRVWEEVRRTLGRLVGRVTTHPLPEAQSGISVSISHSPATEFAEPGVGQREEEGRLPATVRRLTPPLAAAGGEGVDLASVLTVIGANHTLAACSPSVMVEECAFGGGRVHAWSLDRDRPQAVVRHAEPLRFDRVAVQVPEVRWAAPPVHTLPAPGVAILKPGRGPDLSWKLSLVRTRSSLPQALRVPLTCERLDPGTAGPQTFAAERRLLAVATGNAEADVALIGVFPHVPLGAVQRLAMSQDGKGLEVWLKPGALGRTTPHQTMTVVLGRQRSTGRVLQTVRLPGAAVNR